MTGKEFINRLANDESDIVQILLDILSNRVYFALSRHIHNLRQHYPKPFGMS